MKMQHIKENVAKNVVDVTKHVLSHQVIPIIVAHGVDKKTSNKTMNRYENAIHKKKYGYKCDQCDKTFAFSSSYSRHKRFAHGVQEKTSNNTLGIEKLMFICAECGVKCNRKDSLVAHIARHHGVGENYRCDRCDKNFTFLSSYSRHKRVAHGVRKLPKQTSNKTESCHENAVYIKRCDNVCGVPECGSIFSTAYELNRHENAVHKKGRSYECDQCDKTFTFSSSYSRHKRVVHSVHEKTSNKTVNRHENTVHKKRLSYKCDECDKTFTFSSSYSRHKRVIHSVHEKTSNKTVNRHENTVHRKKCYKCDQCDKTFTFSSSYSRHKRFAHGGRKKTSNNTLGIEKPIFICAECGVKCSRKDSLVVHIASQHGCDEYECHHCGFKVSEKRRLVRHIFAKHFSKKDCMPVKNGPFKCVLCEISYYYLNQLNEHYVDKHHVKLNAETLSFTSMEEFSSWKNKLEDSTITRFRLRGKFKNTFRYICHRSGFYNNQSTGKRALFHRGSKKLNGYCPASITLKLNKDKSSYTATFIPTHVGHAQNDTKELKFIFFRKEERENLAKRIAAGVPLRRILDDEALLHLSPNEITRRALRSKDLYNLQASFNIKASGNFVGLRKNDSKSIEEFIYEYKHSILLHKRQGESGPEEFSDCKLNDNDMILVFMSPSQKNILKTYGNEVVCLDGTHSLNPYGLILHILLVLDYDGDGIPVAFLFSNRNDKMVIKVFLRCIREKMCEITSPHTLMTDMEESYYNAWIEEMGKPQLHLYCIWHVWRAWEMYLPKKNEQLKEDLCDLTVETCPNTFQAKLKKILSPNADNEVNSFLKYFKEQYCDDNKWMHWSYAYRMHCGINISTHLEAFHDTMKYFFSRGKTVRDLYSGLKIIVRYVRRKTYDLNMKLIYGNIPTGLSALKKAHKAAEAKGNIFIQKIGEEWLVPSFKGPKDGCEELYTVCKSHNTCPAEKDEEIGICPLICRKCDMCAHKYTCSCIENSIRLHMCKHIHAVVLFERTFQDSIEPPLIHNRSVSCSSSIKESTELAESTLPFSNNDDNEKILDENTESFASDDGNDKTQKDEQRKKLEKRMAELMRNMKTEEQFELMNSCLDAYQRSSRLKKQFGSMTPEQYPSYSIPSSSLQQPNNIQQNPHHFTLIAGSPVKTESNNFTISNQPNSYQQETPRDTAPYHYPLLPSATLSQNSHPQMRLLVPSQDSLPIEMYSIVETSYDT